MGNTTTTSGYNQGAEGYRIYQIADFTMTHLLKKAIRQLERMPADEQNKWASRILQDARSEEEPHAPRVAEPYSSFQVLRNAHLDGPPNASVTYERDLYSLGPGDDE